MRTIRFDSFSRCAQDYSILKQGAGEEKGERAQLSNILGRTFYVPHRLAAFPFCLSRYRTPLVFQEELHLQMLSRARLALEAWTRFCRSL